MLKHLRSVGYFEQSDNKIKAHWKPCLEREKVKYKADKCSLKATLMKSRSIESKEDCPPKTKINITCFVCKALNPEYVNFPCECNRYCKKCAMKMATGTAIYELLCSYIFNDQNQCNI